MSQSDVSELLQAVRSLLRDELLPNLEGFSAYNARVAANCLAIATREVEGAAELAAIDQALAQARGMAVEAGGAGPALARRLRDGGEPVDKLLLDYLQRRAIKQLEIDNPRYSGLLRARQQWESKT
jgi:Domain of unknown function (DUF6285)